MLTIKTKNMEVIRQNNDLMNLTPTSESVYIKFVDGIELIIPIRLDNRVRAALELVTKSAVENITVDLTNPTSPVSLGM